MFDGNIHSSGGEYAFDPTLNRTIAVAATVIEEGLEKVYGMDRIVAELTAWAPSRHVAPPVALRARP